MDAGKPTLRLFVSGGGLLAVEIETDGLTVPVGVPPLRRRARRACCSAPASASTKPIARRRALITEGAAALVFVPMLFVLPMPWVPLVVAGCTVADLLPDLARGQAGMFRVATIDNELLVAC